MSRAYQEFLAAKAITAPMRGLSDVPPLADHLFKFQRDAVDFGLRAGSWGCFFDTGLGKTRTQLEWCAHAAEATNGRALILTPLAVARQIEREGQSCGYAVRVVRSADDVREGISVCNYDRLHLLEPDAFGAVSLDEASILKNFIGRVSTELIETFAHHRFRCAATATPAPNDHTELAQHAAYLGVMDRSEMLVRWFINDSGDTKSWRLKGHAVTPFFDWMASWARMAEHPRDVGDDIPGFDLIPLAIIRHQAEEPESPITGGLFGGDVSATGIHDLKRQTIGARARVIVDLITNDWANSTGSDKLAACGSPNTPSGERLNTKTAPKNERGERLKVGRQSETAITCATTIKPTKSDGTNRERNALSQSTPSGDSVTPQIKHTEKNSTIRLYSAEPWLIFCDTDYEQDVLERLLVAAFGERCVFSVRGSQTAETKENYILGWISGERPILLSKASIVGYGLNFQHCARVAFVGRSFSYESWYQAVRRCWRFGQTRRVQVHLVVAEGEDAIGRVIDRKADDHGKLRNEMKAAMRRALGRDSARRVAYRPTHRGRLPEWLTVSS